VTLTFDFVTLKVVSESRALDCVWFPYSKFVPKTKFFQIFDL